MNRKEAAELLPIIKAFTEGRIIEFSSITDVSKAWREVTDFPLGMINSFKFRIKPEPKRRPFANAEECWQEMAKHQPFGWVKSTLFKDLALVQRVTTLYVEINRDIIDYKDTLEKFTFADGTPFGILEEK